MYLGFQSALAAYRNPATCRLLLAAARMTAAECGYGAVDRAPLSSDPETCALARAACGIGAEVLKLHVLVPKDGMRRSSHGLACHVWSDLDSAFFYKIAPDVYLSTPEFLFLQMAARADFENRYMLASELMGSYALDARSPSGVVARLAPCSREELVGYLSVNGPRRGCSPLLRVAELVLPGARSPKEAELGALLALPRRLGGRGVRMLELDHEIVLSADARIIAGRSSLFADCYMGPEPPQLGARGGKRLAGGVRRGIVVQPTDIEYDSDAEHLSSAMNEADKRRANALRRDGIDLITVTKGQLHDWSTFDAIAEHVVAASGIAMRPASDAIRDRQYRLWRRLLFGKRVGGRIVMPSDAPPEDLPRC